MAAAQQEKPVAQHQLTKKVGPAGGGVVAVGHVGLVAEVHEALTLEIRHAVGALGARAVVVAVVGLDGLQHRQPSHAGIEDADGQVTKLPPVVGGAETCRRVALGVRSGVGHHAVQHLVAPGGRTEQKGQQYRESDHQVRSVR